MEVMNAMEIGLKYSLSADFAGISLKAYKKNSPIDVRKAYLKIVPYWVIKNPSEPSLITSAMSYMAFGPVSLFRISQSIQMLINMKTIEKFHALKDIKLDVLDDMKK
jgi:hypothetical protein